MSEREKEWSEYEINILTSMFMNDESDESIAKELNLTLNQVKNKIRRLNLTSIHKRPTRAINLVGQTFGRLKVLYRASNKVYSTNRQRAQWVCECQCKDKNKIVVSGHDLISGHTRSCGCLAKELTRERNKANRTQNQYIIDEENNIAVGITASGIKFAIDLEDLDKIKQYKWNSTQDGYIQAHDFDDKRTTIRLSRIIMNVHGEDWINLQVDHINHIPNDNRKCNLRIADSFENQRNKYFTYVSFNKASGKWQARITINGQRIYLGLYDNERMALDAVNEYKKKNTDEFSYEKSMEIANKNGYIDFDKYVFETKD